MVQKTRFDTLFRITRNRKQSNFPMSEGDGSDLFGKLSNFVVQAKKDWRGYLLGRLSNVGSKMAGKQQIFFTLLLSKGRVAAAPEPLF